MPEFDDPKNLARPDDPGADLEGASLSPSPTTLQDKVTALQRACTALGKLIDSFSFEGV